MSESAAVLPPITPTGNPYFEQRLYVWSPLGALGTTTVLFFILYGTYLLAALIEGATPFVWTGHGVAFQDGAWPSLVLSLLICAALGMQRYSRLRDAEDYHRFAPIFSEETAMQLSAYAPYGVQLGRSTVMGLIAGVLIGALVVSSEGIAVRLSQAGTTAWFLVAIILLSLLFARGMELTRRSSSSFAVTVRDELKIDLLRIDKLSVIGRSAARVALIWIVVSAIACLFFVGGDFSIVSIATMLGCALMGIVIFVRTILGVHRKIVAAKTVELEHVRSHIDTARAAMLKDTGAAARVHGLIAYEKRIEDAPEWPLDQTTLVRVGASMLIVTVPWFGQAIVQFAIERMGH